MKVGNKMIGTMFFFSDESKLCSKKSGVEYVRKVRGSQWTKPMLTEENQYHNGLEIMVWGLISSEGPVFLEKVDGRQNADDYIQLLQKTIITKRALKNKNAYFQQDNAPSHSAKKVEKFLSENKIKVLYWPPQSPDMSPIENVWAHIKNQLYNMKENITSKENLFKQSKKIFFSSACTEIIKKLYNQMPQRVQELIECKGENVIKY
ncbi:hypothetical protein ABPG72_020107 [Tetrahymena utriculariae]